MGEIINWVPFYRIEDSTTSVYFNDTYQTILIQLERVPDYSETQRILNAILIARKARYMIISTITTMPTEILDFHEEIRGKCAFEMVYLISPLVSLTQINLVPKDINTTWINEAYSERGIAQAITEITSLNKPIGQDNFLPITDKELYYTCVDVEFPKFDNPQLGINL